MRLDGARCLVTGAAGMLGTDVTAHLESLGAHVRAVARHDLDITDAAAAAVAVAGMDVVINCAAHTAVDAAEADEPAATHVNTHGAGVLAVACATAGVRLVHVSTDYVFSGDGTEPYAEDTPVSPLTAYGRTKAAGEAEVLASGADSLIVRTAWLYGANGPCFPKTIARAGAERGALQVVDDQIGQPTWTRDLADFIARLLAADAPAGIYHGTASGHTTWYGFAKEIVASAGLGDIVKPTDSASYPRAAPRPAWSVLAHLAAPAVGVHSIGDWDVRWRAAADEVLR